MSEARAHPDVLGVRWQVYANQERWEEALDLADAFIRKAADRPEGHIHVASSLQELGRAQEALAVLLQAAQRFPQDEIILYDLACLCCLLGQSR